MNLIERIHHVAYRCKDAKQTVDWYEKHLGMRFVLAIAENEVPSTKAPDPYMHVFLDAGNGNVLAFFELPGQPPMGMDPNGHRLELAADTGTPTMYRELDEVKREMLAEWSRTRRAPRHAAWMHDGTAAVPEAKPSGFASVGRVVGQVPKQPGNPHES